MRKLDDLILDNLSSEQVARLIVAREIELRRDSTGTDEEVDSAIQYVYGFRRRQINGWLWILRSIKAMDEAAHKKYLELTISDHRVWDSVLRNDDTIITDIIQGIYYEELTSFIELHVAETLLYRFSNELYDPLADLESHEDFEILIGGANWHALRDNEIRKLLVMSEKNIASYCTNFWTRIEKIAADKHGLFLHKEYGDTPNWATNYIYAKVRQFDEQND